MRNNQPCPIKYRISTAMFSTFIIRARRSIVKDHTLDKAKQLICQQFYIAIADGNQTQCPILGHPGSLHENSLNTMDEGELIIMPLVLNLAHCTR